MPSRLRLLLLLAILPLSFAATASEETEVAPRIVAATVGLVPADPEEGRAEVGSGVIVRSDGLILTAAHTLGAPKRAFHVRLSDGRWARAVSLGVCRERDIGMAKILGESEWPHLSLAEEPPPEGAVVLAAGHSGGIEAGRPPPIRSGRVLAAGPAGIHTTCALVSGDSGGPLIDQRGCVVGIHVRLAPTEREAHHAPVADFRRLWDRLEAGEVVADAIPKSPEPTAASSRAGRLLLRLADGDEQAWAEADAALPGPEERKALRELLAGAERSDSGGIVLRARSPSGLRALSLLTRSLGTVERPAPPVPQAVRDAPGTVEVLAGEARVALGTLVRVDGCILTKSSEVPESPSVRIGGRRFDAQVVARRPEDDLALLKVEAGDLAPVRWANGAGPTLGVRVFAAGPDGKVSGAGIVGVAAARVSPDFEFLLGPDVSVRRKADSEEGAVAAIRAISGMSGGTSSRRRGFPIALRHDARVSADACGGPLLDLEGRAIGINIAAHDLTCALAIPASRIHEILPALLEEIER